MLLRWELRSGTARGRLAVEEHRPHRGAEGPKCGRRRLVGLLPAGRVVRLWVTRSGEPVVYRLLDARGTSLAAPIRLRAVGGGGGG